MSVYSLSLSVKFYPSKAGYRQTKLFRDFFTAALNLRQKTFAEYSVNEVS